MKKRGQLVLKALFVIITCAIIILAFVRAGKSYSSQEAYYKLAVARDLAITIDLMYAFPGDFEFTYPNDVSSYDIEVKDNLVRVYYHNSRDSDITIANHPFAGTGSDNLNFVIRGEKFVKIEKIGLHIVISGVDG